MFGVEVADRAGSRVGLGWWALAERPVGTVRVVVLGVLAEHDLEVAPSEDEYPVEALSPGGAHEPLGDGVGPRRPDRGLDDPDALCGEEASKDPVNFESRSRIRNLTAAARSASSMQMLRACWVT